jgi:hypothetical protein
MRGRPNPDANIITSTEIQQKEKEKETLHLL